MAEYKIWDKQESINKRMSQNSILSLLIKQKSYENISNDKFVSNESPSASEVKPNIRNDIYCLKGR